MPAITNAIHSSDEGSRAIPIEPVPSVSSAPAHSTPRGYFTSRGAPNAIARIATVLRSASSSPICPNVRPCVSCTRPTRMTQIPQYWPNAQ